MQLWVNIVGVIVLPGAMVALAYLKFFTSFFEKRREQRRAEMVAVTKEAVQPISEAVAVIQAELSPNSGTSMKDRVDQTHATVKVLEAQHKGIETRLGNVEGALLQTRVHAPDSEVA